MSTLISPAPAPGRSRLQDLLRQSYGLVQALLVLAILVVAMSILSPRFLTWINISNLMGQMAANLVVAAGMTIVMISGEFDISVGSIVALTASICAYLLHQVGIVPAVLVSLLVGPAFGIVNGLVVTKARIPRSSSRSAR